MADIKLGKSEQALFEEVGSRGDHFREAVRDRAGEQVHKTGRMSEITADGEQMLDVVMAPVTTSVGETVADVVKPSDYSPVIGTAPGKEPEPKNS